MSIFMINDKAEAVCARLAERFHLPFIRPDPIEGHVSIGAEVEVKFSSFFPKLWQDFDLDRRSFKDLDPHEMREFSQRCTQEEATLLPKLNATVEAGVPRGADRYWEFALNPCTDVSLLVEQVELLTDAGLIPRDRPHSLQLTLGDLRATPDVYYLALALELRCIDRERIEYGLEQAAKVIFTGPLRKGRGGVFEKSGIDLQLGSQVACEVRALQLPLGRDSFEDLMRVASWGANAIGAKQGVVPDPDPECVERFVEFVAKTQQSLKDHGIPDRNWTSGDAVDRGAWLSFADHLDDLRSDLVPKSKSPRP